MPHYAELNSDNVVKRIIFVNEATDDFSGAEDETVGSSILKSLHGENTIWKKCSAHNDDIDSRGLCTLDMVYNQEHDKFITASPSPSWTLNSSLQWVSPVEEPSITAEQFAQGLKNIWDEETSSWTSVTDAVVTVTVQPSDATVSVGSSATFNTGATVTKGEFAIYLEKEGDDGWKIVQDTEIEGNSIHTSILTSTESSGKYRVVYEPLELEGRSGLVAHSTAVTLTVNE